MVVKEGDTIKVEYIGMLEDGTIFDKSKEGVPLQFTVGKGEVLLGFEKAVIGMELNEEKEIKLSPEEAYGNYNPNLVKEIPKEQLKGLDVKEGMFLAININGMQIPAKVAKVSEQTITLDLNHPLAGKTLLFKIKVVEILS